MCSYKYNILHDNFWDLRKSWYIWNTQNNAITELLPNVFSLVGESKDLPKPNYIL